MNATNNSSTGSPHWRTVRLKCASDWESDKQTGITQGSKEADKAGHNAFVTQFFMQTQSILELDTLRCLGQLPQVAFLSHAPSQTHTILCALSYNNRERTGIKLDWHMYTLLPLMLHK